MPNWKNIVEKQNADTYKFPAGWSTREEVAEDLECSTERVAQILAPGVKNGSVERGEFMVWDRQLKRVVRVTGYRERLKQSGKPPVKAPLKVDDEMTNRILAYAKSNPGTPAHRIAAHITLKGVRPTTAQVKEVLGL